jgi:nicotinamide phosphoribosyltransferase
VDDEVLWFGLQFLLEELSAFRVTEEHVREASLRLKDAFMGNGEVFNEAGWLRIAKSGGRLPIEIRALPEGSAVRPWNSSPDRGEHGPGGCLGGCMG